MLLTEYDEKKVWDSFKKDVYEDGVEKGIEKAEYRCFKNCLDRGMTFEDAKALSGARDEDADRYYSKWLGEKQ